MHDLTASSKFYDKTSDINSLLPTRCVSKLVKYLDYYSKKFKELFTDEGVINIDKERVPDLSHLSVNL